MEDETHDEQQAIEEQIPDKEQPSPDQEEAVVKDETPDQQRDLEEQTPDEEQSAEEGQVREQESAAVLPEPPADEEAADRDEEGAVLKEQLTNEESSAKELADQQAYSAEEQAREEELAEIAEAQPTYELPSVDGDPTIQVRVAFTVDQASGEQTRVIEQVAKDGGIERQLIADPDLVANPLEQTTGGRPWQLFFVNNPLVQIEPGPSDDELDWSWDLLDKSVSTEGSTVVAAEDGVELFVEPDEVPYPSIEDMGMNSWILYADVYRAASTPVMDQDELNWNFDWDWDSGSQSSGPKQNGSGNRRGAEVTAEADAR